MKKLIISSLALLIASFIFTSEGVAQNTFKNRIGPIADSIGAPYKYINDNTILMTYCGTDVDCVPVYITNQYLYSEEISRVVQCYTILFRDDISTPPKSLIQKLNEINSEFKYGKFGILVIDNSYLVFYQNEIWFDELDYNSLVKNIQVNFYTSLNYKNEFSVFNEQ